MEAERTQPGPACPEAGRTPFEHQKPGDEREFGKLEQEDESTEPSTCSDGVQASFEPPRPSEQEVRVKEQRPRSQSIVMYACACNSFERQASCQSVGEAAFSWLGMIPGQGSCKSKLQDCFPGALPGAVVVQRAAKALERYGLDPDNTLYGQSLCSDEINHVKGGLSNLMIEHWGEVFPMGGIGGAPFVGKTGFAAFASHVPSDGHIFILFGPHIGISANGTLGKVKRPGQEKHSRACGAVLAAYDSCCEGAPLDFDEADMQQSWLRQQISKRLSAIQASDEPMLALVRAAYDCVKDSIMAILNHNFGDGHIVLLGGIQLNMPEPLPDYFQPLTFQVLQKDGSVDSLLQDMVWDEGGSSKMTAQSHLNELFHWMAWSPSPSSPCFETLARCFPQALPSPAVVKRLATVLAPLGMTPENTIYGHSLCPDEINNGAGGLASTMIDYWGEVFPMGGIGGAPFVGKNWLLGVLEPRSGGWSCSCSLRSPHRNIRGRRARPGVEVWTRGALKSLWCSFGSL